MHMPGRPMRRQYKGRTISLVAAAAEAAAEAEAAPTRQASHATADGAEWMHPDSPVGLLLAMGKEAAAWPRQRRQAVRVLQALRPAAALAAMGSSLHEVERVRRRSGGSGAEAGAEAEAVTEAMERARAEHSAREEAEVGTGEIAMELALVSQLHPAAPLEVQRFGCRALARVAKERGKRRRILHHGGTAAALAICRRVADPPPPALLVEALVLLLNISSEPANQARARFANWSSG